MNMLGLGNAATPFGLKAMKELQRLNNTTTASRSMITFLVINTSSVTIIPTTVISIRILNNSINPTSIVPLTIITTFISTFLSLVLDRLFYILWRKDMINYFIPIVVLIIIIYGIYRKVDIFDTL